MVREVKTTITKRSARQMRSLEADSDQEFQQAEATPLDTSIDQKKNYAVDGLVAALDKLNPAVGAIFQKKNAIARDKDAKAGTAAGMMNTGLQGDESERFKENYFAQVAHNEAGKATVELEQAQATRDRTVPYATWIAEQRAKAEADMAGESDSYKISYMTRYDASLERVRQGEIAKQKEEIAETQSAMLSTTLEDTITAAELDGRTITSANLSSIRQGFLAQGMDKKRINDNFIATAIDIAARTGDESFLDLLEQPTVDGTPGIAGQNQYKARIMNARRVAAAYNKANDEKTKAQIYQENFKPVSEKYYAVLKEAGDDNGPDKATLLAKLKANQHLYADMDMYEEHKASIVDAHKKSNLDPMAHPQYKMAIEGYTDPDTGEWVAPQKFTRMDLVKTGELTNAEIDNLMEFQEKDHSIAQKIVENRHYKDNLSNLKESLAAELIGAKPPFLELGVKQAEFIDRKVNMAILGFQTEMRSQPTVPTREFAEQKFHEWATAAKRNISGWKAARQMENDMGIIYGTEEEYLVALKQGYVSKYSQGIHKAFFKRIGKYGYGKPPAKEVTKTEAVSFDDSRQTDRYNTPSADTP